MHINTQNELLEWHRGPKTCVLINTYHILGAFSARRERQINWVWTRALLCGLCIYSLCQHGLSPGTLASFYSLKTCRLGLFVTPNRPLIPPTCPGCSLLLAQSPRDPNRIYSYGKWMNIKFIKMCCLHISTWGYQLNIQGWSLRGPDLTTPLL